MVKRTYTQRLTNQRWTKLKEYVKKKDKKCFFCHYDIDDLEIRSVKGYEEVHHLAYIKNRYPWEYHPDMLVVCHKNCHKKWHDENEYRVFDDEKTALSIIREELKIAPPFLEDPFRHHEKKKTHRSTAITLEADMLLDKIRYENGLESTEILVPFLEILLPHIWKKLLPLKNQKDVEILFEEIGKSISKEENNKQAIEVVMNIFNNP